jgi:hypothetical protein
MVLREEEWVEWVEWICKAVWSAARTADPAPAIQSRYRYAVAFQRKSR